MTDYPLVIQPVENTTTLHSTSYMTESLTITPTSAAAYTTSSVPPLATEEPTKAPVQASHQPLPPPPKIPAPPAEHNIKPAKQSAKKPSSPPDTQHLAAAGSQWCMTYSPYTSAGGCKPSNSIEADIVSIARKGFSSVRLYSTDCSGLPTVASVARSHGLNLVLGVYVSESGIAAARPQIKDIIIWADGNWQGIEMVVVGNEAIFNHFCTAGELASFIQEAKSAFSAAGYTGPVTTTETVETLTENAGVLCSVMDIAAANIHPFFNDGVSANMAGNFVADQLELLAKVCPGKEGVYNLETGWPNKGSPNGAAVPGSWEQEVAIRSIQEHAGGKSAFFSFVDDAWKDEGEFGVERNFGCGQLF